MAHTDNVCGFWDLDSDSTDKSGNGNAGTDTSMSYDGTYGVFSGSGYVVLPSGMLASTVATWSVWCQLDASPPSYSNVVNMGNTLGNSLFGVGAADTEDRFYCAYNFGYYDAGAALHTLGLCHVVVTTDGSTSKVYLNGVKGVDGTTNFADFNASIGKAVGGWSNFKGKIRCVALYAVTKDATWVTDDYNAGTPKKWADWNAGGGGVTAHDLTLLGCGN